MARSFEDLIIWQKARRLVSRSFDLVEIEELRNLWSFKNQLTRASLSIMNNIAEGFERGGNQEFIHFLGISKASAGEVRSMFYVMLDREWIDDDTFNGLRREVVEISSGIQGLIKHLQRSDFDGNRKRKDEIRDDVEWSPEVKDLSPDIDDSFFQLEQNTPG